MKILAVSDEASPGLWDYYSPERVRGVDLIISCGDLRKEYLEFLTTMVNVPLVYVWGNHDDSYASAPPEGCTDIDGKVFVYRGIRIAGLGGSLRYREGGCMYSEQQMSRRIRKLRRKIQKAGGVDLFVTHAPARGMGDLDDLPHRGFACFHDFLLEHRPAYMLHGHVHQAYDYSFRRERVHESGSKIINCCGYYMLQIPDRDFNS